jgi:hypothetical protein
MFRSICNIILYFHFGLSFLNSIMSEQPCIIDLSMDDEDIVRDCVVSLVSDDESDYEPELMLESDDEPEPELEPLSDDEEPEPELFSDDYEPEPFSDNYEPEPDMSDDDEPEPAYQPEPEPDMSDDDEPEPAYQPEPEPVPAYQPAHAFEDLAGMMARTGILETFLAGGPTQATMSTSWWTYWLSNKAVDTWMTGVWTRKEKKNMILSLHPDKANSLRDARMTDEDHRWMDKLSQNLNEALNEVHQVIPCEMYEIIYLLHNELP